LHALAALGSESAHTFIVLDNHHTSDVVLAVLDADGVSELPPAIWDRVADVRESVIRTVEELAPPSSSFVFTNVLTQDKPTDRQVVERLRVAAQRTNRTYLPVVLRCDADLLVLRAENASRRARRKWIDAEAIAAFTRSTQLIDVTDLNPLTIDTSTTQPRASAALILSHLDR
jgi:hypothetical protein